LGNMDIDALLSRIMEIEAKEKSTRLLHVDHLVLSSLMDMNVTSTVLICN
jgi:hypothetical protein